MPMCAICKEIVGVVDINSDGICSKCSSPELELRIEDFFITTENIIDIPIEKRIEVIFVEYVYGLNIIKDFFASIRDLVGGRVESIEKPIHDTNQKIIVEMKKKAITLGGDAVIGLKIDYQTGGGFISVLAVGTVVKFKDNEIVKPKEQNIHT